MVALDWLRFWSYLDRTEGSKNHNDPMASRQTRKHVCMCKCVSLHVCGRPCMSSEIGLSTSNFVTQPFCNQGSGSDLKFCPCRQGTAVRAVAIIAKDIERGAQITMTGKRQCAYVSSSLDHSGNASVCSLLQLKVWSLNAT